VRKPRWNIVRDNSRPAQPPFPFTYAPCRPPTRRWPPRDDAWRWVHRDVKAANLFCRAHLHGPSSASPTGAVFDHEREALARTGGRRRRQGSGAASSASSCAGRGRRRRFRSRPGLTRDETRARSGGPTMLVWPPRYQMVRVEYEQPDGFRVRALRALPQVVDPAPLTDGLARVPVGPAIFATHQDLDRKLALRYTLPPTTSVAREIDNTRRWVARSIGSATNTAPGSLSIPSTARDRAYLREERRCARSPPDGLRLR
jgi:hypothetical protein